ncbi:hypothetical protein [Leucobacter aridicollis]|uniref:hypothetical protein n=1 Tax=Leucobacter aridicollis TaxID=283878 RepID=UPI002107CFC8|nr:hypothetical protein [Leucobacter aridicollis]UTX53305.1 hypothetical protein KI794_00605 [Leucobacter aridicollis]
MVKKQWNRNTVIGVVSGVVVVLTAIAITIFLLLPGGDMNPNGSEAEQRPTPGANTDTSKTGDDDAPADSEPDMSLWEPAKLDSTGMAEMVVTTDPEQAALSAARVLWSVDASKQPFYEDFLNEALTRVMHPSPDYVGAEGVIRSTIDRSKSNLGHTEWVTGNVVDTEVDVARESTWNPDGGAWWELGDEKRYNALIGHGIAYTSHPIEALNAEQAVAEGYDVNTTIEETWEADSLPGTYSKYWVRVESAINSGGESGSGVHRVRNATSMLIYCDAPENGGICGVAALTKSYPKQWQRQQ